MESSTEPAKPVLSSGERAEASAGAWLGLPFGLDPNFLSPINLTPLGPQELNTVVSVVPNATAIVDRAGFIRYFNASFAKIFGYDSDALHDCNLAQLIPHYPRDLMRSLAPKPAETPYHLAENPDLIGYRRDGVAIVVTFNCTLVAGLQGPMLVCNVSDISEQRRREEEMHRVNQDLSNFARIASHDLRAPLMSVGHLVDFIEDDVAAILPQSARDNLIKVKARIKRMDKMLMGLLEFSLPSSIRRKIEAVDVGEMAQEIFELIGGEEHFSLVIPQPIPVIQGSRTLLHIILRNLLSNAAKHHDRNSGVIALGYNQAATHHEFAVIDDGPGIPAEFQNLVFEPFETMPGKDKCENVGLGLAIVKRAVTLHGGTIELISEGRGATFIFRCPLNIETKHGRG